MGLLRSLDDGPGTLKAGFLGFQGSGKTFTAIELAIGTRQHFGLEGPIAFFDTESGSSYVKDRVREATGQKLVGTWSRSLKDLIDVTQECLEEGVSVLVVDSVTHVWREVMKAYKAQTGRKNLQFQDWGPIKERWYEWSDLFLNSPVHTIICGRAGWEWDQEENDRGKKELVKVGTKMKAEAEFGFEPSLLVEMDSVGPRVRRATVVKDRFNVIDGAQGENPSFAFFKPHLDKLTGPHATIDMNTKTTFDVEDENWPRERKQRQILSEEIQGELVRAFPGQTAKEKTAKVAALDKHFGSKSWTKISENTPSVVLRNGLETLRLALGNPDPLQLPDWAEGGEVK